MQAATNSSMWMMGPTMHAGMTGMHQMEALKLNTALSEMSASIVAMFVISGGSQALRARAGELSRAAASSRAATSLERRALSSGELSRATPSPQRTTHANTNKHTRQQQQACACF